MKKDFFYYFKRAFVDINLIEKDYESEIKGKPRDKSLSQSVDIFKDCFGHHFHVEYDTNINKIVVLSEQNTKLVLGNHITSYFMSNHYELPNIEIYDNIEYGTIIFDDFIEKIILNPSYVNQKRMTTNINFLIGDTGEGKTLFCCYLRRFFYQINKNHIKKRYSFSNQETIIPIYLNFDELIFKKGEKLDEISYINYNNFRKILFDSIKNEINNYLPNNNFISDFKILDKDPIHPDNISNYTLKRFIKHLKKFKINLLLIFDNLDRYYFHFSKHLFFDEFRDKQRVALNNSIGELIDYFTQDSTDNLSNLGINVLFVTREYVYHNLKNSVLNPANNNVQMFKITNDQYNIMMSRFYLYKDVVKAILVKYPKKKKIYDSDFWQDDFLNYISDTHDLGENNHVKTIFKIGHQKNRSFVDFLQSLHALSNGKLLIDRFITRKQRAIVILYILNNKRKYTQEKEHFPNIFLNDSSVCSKEVPEEFRCKYKPHLHTYWLKYFTLKIVYKQDTTLNKVLKILNRCDNSYPKELIQLALGSLNMDNEFKCIKINEQPSVVSGIMNRNITTTARGEYLLQKENHGSQEIEFCFNFLHLQLVIDDYLLSLPEFIFDKIYDNKINYKYLLSDDDSSYSEGSSEMINFKAKAVMYFIQVLKVSFQIEMDYRKEVFLNIKNENIEFPNFLEIENALIRDVTAIIKFANKKYLDTNLIPILENIRNDEKLNNELKDFFIDYLLIEENCVEDKFVTQF